MVFASCYYKNIDELLSTGQDTDSSVKLANKSIFFRIISLQSSNNIIIVTPIDAFFLNDSTG